MNNNHNNNKQPCVAVPKDDTPPNIDVGCCPPPPNRFVFAVDAPRPKLVLDGVVPERLPPNIPLVLVVPNPIVVGF